MLINIKNERRNAIFIHTAILAWKDVDFLNNLPLKYRNRCDILIILFAFPIVINNS